MKLGIALGGGGAKGAAHVGILQALEEHGIKADMYSGTSAGSIVATHKALGIPNETIIARLKTIDKKMIDIAYWNIIKSVPGRFKNLESIIKGDSLKKFLSENIGDKVLSDTHYPLTIVSTDINTGSQVLFTTEKMSRTKLNKIDRPITSIGKNCQLPLSDIVYASCALPGVFPPFPLKEMKLVDGSVTNDLPVNTLKAMGADKIIAIDLGVRNPHQEIKGIFNILQQSMKIMIEQNVDYSVSGATDVIHLNPNVSSIGLLDFDRSMEAYEAGYKYGKRVAPLILRSL